MLIGSTNCDSFNHLIQQLRANCFFLLHIYLDLLQAVSYHIYMILTRTFFMNMGVQKYLCVTIGRKIQKPQNRNCQLDSETKLLNE